MKNKRIITPDGGAELFIVGDLQKQIDDINNKLDDNSNKVGVTAPEFIDIVSQRADRKGVYPLMRFRIPEDTEVLVCYVVKKTAWDASGADANTGEIFIRSKWEEEITEQSIDASGYFLGEFKRPLDFDTTYYVVQLVSKKDGAIFAVNPETPISGNGTPGSGSKLGEFTTKKVFVAVPSTPVAGDILRNEAFLEDGINGNAIVEFRVWVSEDHTAYAEDTDIDEAVVKLLQWTRNGGIYELSANTQAKPVVTKVDSDVAIEIDGTSKHRAIKCRAILPLGTKWRWFQNILWNPAGKGFSPVTFAGGIPTVPAIDFWAGGQVATTDAEIPEPVPVNITQIDSRHSQCQIQFTQAATPILLNKYALFISYDGGTTWKRVAYDKVFGDENIQTTGTKLIPGSSDFITFKHQKNFSQATWKLKARLLGVGRIRTNSGVIDAPYKETITPVNFSPADFAELKGALSIPAGGDITTSINTDTEAADALLNVTIRCYEKHADGTPMDGRDGAHSPAALKSFRDAHISNAVGVFAVDSGGTTEKYKIGGAIQDPTLTSVTFRDIVPLGEKLYWKKNRGYNGEGNIDSVATTAVTVTSGGLRIAANSVEVPTPSFNSITQHDNKHTKVTVRFTQSNPATFLKKCIVEVSLDNGVTWHRPESGGFNLKNEESFHTASTTYDIKFLIKHPANVAQLKFQTKIVAVGGQDSGFVISGASATNPDLIKDTTAPTGLNTPNIAWDASSKLIVSNLKFADTPEVGNWRTLKEKYIRIRDTVSNKYLKFTHSSGSAVAVGTTTDAVEARLSVGLQNKVSFPDLRRKFIDNSIGSSTWTLVASWVAENDISVSSASADSAGLSSTNAEDFLGSRNAVNAVDIGVNLTSKTQVAFNGDFLYADTVGGSTVVNVWRRWTASSPGSGATGANTSSIDTTTTNNIYWDKDNNALIWRDGAVKFGQNFNKRIKKGEFLTVSVLLKTPGTFASQTTAKVKCDFVDEDGLSLAAAIPENLLTDVVAGYNLFVFPLQVNNASFNTAKRKWLQFSTDGTLSTSNPIHASKAMVVRSKEPASFAPRVVSLEGDGTSFGTAEDISLTTQNVVDQPDIYRPSSQGGGFPTGTGGRLSPEAPLL